MPVLTLTLPRVLSLVSQTLSTCLPHSELRPCSGLAPHTLDPSSSGFCASCFPSPNNFDVFNSSGGPFFLSSESQSSITL